MADMAARSFELPSDSSDTPFISIMNCYASSFGSQKSCNRLSDTVTAYRN